MEQFVPLPISGLPPAQAVQRVRLNGLGSLFYFISVPLKRRRLTSSLHRPLCQALEKLHIKDVHEWPRDHYKSTICSEGLPMWWALPFTDADANEFTKLGYSDEYLRWMRAVHNPAVRNCLISENITNAAKLGSRIRYHFESNDIYRAAFPDTLPTSAETWSSFSLQVFVPKNLKGPHGEGTFDFLGVGGALQSRHYHKLIEDDIIGRKAIESVSIMEKSKDYHRLLVGAFEEADDASHEGDELVVGNRWSYHDLNSHIREQEDWFRFHTHGALGGCCTFHPPDTPIFPEAFSFEKLMRIKQREGTYNFSCQFLNNPAAPDNADFKPEWLRYYVVKQDNNGKFITHNVSNGEVIKDIRQSHLRLAMTIDPAHSGNAGDGRCRHAIVVVGLSAEGNYYLLDTWAKACGYDEFINQIYKLADEYHLTKFGIESLGGQQFLLYHINFLNRLEQRNLKLIPLKGEVEGPNGEITRRKEWRIRNVLLPIFESGRFWIKQNQQDFYGEYTTFPKGRFVDQLDALAYAPQMITLPQRREFYRATMLANQRYLRQVNAPICTPIN